MKNEINKSKRKFMKKVYAVPVLFVLGSLSHEAQAGESCITLPNGNCRPGNGGGNGRGNGGGRFNN